MSMSDVDDIYSFSEAKGCNRSPRSSAAARGAGAHDRYYIGILICMHIYIYIYI